MMIKPAAWLYSTSSGPYEAYVVRIKHLGEGWTETPLYALPAPATDEALIEAVARAIDAAMQNARLGQGWQWFEPEARAAIAAMQAHITAREQAIRDKALDDAAARCADRVARAEQAIRICPKKDAEFHREAMDTAKFLGAAILALKEQHK